MSQASLSQRIRKARTALGISQAKLAQAMDVDRSSVGHWEGAHASHPGHVRLANLAKVLGVSFEWLATGRGPMRLNADRSDDIPAAFGRLVDDADTLRLLKAWDSVPSRMREAMLEIIEHVARSRTPKVAREADTVHLESGWFDGQSGRRIGP